MHLLVVFFVLIAILGLLVKVGLLILCALNFVYADSLRRKALPKPELIFNKEVFCIADERGELVPLEFFGKILSSPYLVILCFKSSHARKKRIKFTIFRDSLSSESWRQLRVLLRTERGLGR